MSFELFALVYRKSRHANAREAEMIRTVVMAGFRMRVRLDCEAKLFRGGFDHRIERGALRSGHFHFFRLANRSEAVIIQVERNLCPRNRRMLAEILRAEQALL